MDITRALNVAVNKFPHGTAALADALGLGNKHSLNNKVNPLYDGAHCSPEETLQIMQITGNHGALYALCDSLGYVPVKIQQACVDNNREAATESLLASIRGFADLTTSISQARSQNSPGGIDITDNELGEIEQRAVQAIAAITEVVARAKANNLSCKPAALRPVANCAA